MNVVILAGGFGTRFKEFTKHMPKPMIPVLGRPIITHIMEHFIKFGFKNFIIATGYKHKIIENYFKKKEKKWNVQTIYTGKNTMTGGRILRLKKFLSNKRFFATYGDGISNVNLKKLLNFHNKKNKIATLTAVRPPARFGAIKINGSKVKVFREKSKLDEGWINGGFFVFESTIFEYLNNDQTFLEKEPLVNLSKKGELLAYKHHGFWQCMDTHRDKEIMEKELKKRKNV